MIRNIDCHEIDTDHLEATFGLIALGFVPTPLGLEQSELLLQRILTSIATEAPAGTMTIRSSALDWQPAGPGIDIKILRADRKENNHTLLIRMQPAAIVVGHGHTQGEECFVLEGEVYIGSHRLSAGDLHVATPGVSHAPISAPHGALLMIRSEIPPLAFRMA